jgi:hypothetical protein
MFAELFPARKSLVSDIPVEEGKIDNLFFTVYHPMQAADAERRFSSRGGRVGGVEL